MTDHRPADQPDTHCQPRPTCPACGYQMTVDDMTAQDETDLFALATSEERDCVACPKCDIHYWVKGGYVPTYTSAFAEEELW